MPNDIDWLMTYAGITLTGYHHPLAGLTPEPLNFFVKKPHPRDKFFLQNLKETL